MRTDEHSQPTDNPSFRDLRGLARHVVYWTVAWAAIQVPLSVFSYLEMQVLATLPADEPVDWLAPILDEKTEAWLAVAGFLFLIIWVISGVLALRWIYFANRNAQGLSGGLDVSPGWNVGWFFVPIATWFKPFQGVDQTWRASHDPTAWRSLDTPSLLRWWWGFWLAATFIGSMAFRLDVRADTAGEQIAAGWFDIASTVFSIPAAYFFIKVVKALTAAQHRISEQSEVQGRPA